MKYWNKDKDVRQRCWISVNRTPGTSSNQEIKRWCQQQPSKGKFYFYYGSKNWWFEKSEDAVIFLMRWA